MKLTPLLVIAILIQIQIAASETEETWLNNNIYHTVSNKTSAFANYIRIKSQKFKKFYYENVRGKLKSYLGLTNKTASGNSLEETKHVNRTRNKRITKDSDTNAEVLRNSSSSEVNETVHTNPGIHMNTVQLIAMNGYPAETHTIVTEDGYILSVHRIPYPKGNKCLRLRKTVLLHHGLLGSSADWVMSGPQNGLAYILSDAGYDVWLANVRGNTYSKAHVSKDIDSYEFWNFTWHEVSQHDLPAVIDYIMELKGWDVKINYIGHSMGTTILFAMLSTKTQYNKVLRAGFALAPVAFMSDVKSPMKYLANFADQVDYLMKLLGANEFIPQTAIVRWLSKFMCDLNHYEAVVCENMIFILCGYDYKQFNVSILPLILAHTPAGASTKTVIHYAQEIRSGGKFQQFDYGPDGNIREYGTVLPPEYPVHKITLPIALLSADNDWLASDEDVTNLYVQLAHPIEHYLVPYKDFNHLDFLFAKDAPKLVYEKLLQLLEEGVGHTPDKDDSNSIVSARLV